MTDKNMAIDAGVNQPEDDDPLAELARIVSGEAANDSQSFSDQVVTDNSTSSVTPVAAVPNHAAVQPNPTNQSAQVLDLEAELMRELGEPDIATEQTPQQDTEVAQPQEIHAETISSQDDAADLIVADAQRAVAEAEADVEVSLEDQLMAELSGEAIATQEPVHEQAQENAVDLAEHISVPSSVPSDELERIEAVSNELAVEASLIDTQTDVEDPTIAAAPATVAEPDMDEFFSKGFEELVTTEEPVATPQIVASQPSDMGVDFDLGSAFTDEVEQNTQAAAAPVELATQTKPDGSEIQLENGFAEAFAQELDLGSHVEEPDSTNEPEIDAAIIAPTDQSGSRSGIKMAIGALCAALVVGLGVVGWGTFNSETTASTDQPIVVKADTEPFKSKPEDPGGQQIANLDNQVYDKVSGNTETEPDQESLISNNEQPLVIEPKSDDRLTADPQDDVEPTTLGLSPKRVKTLTVKPDGTIIQTSTNDINETAPATVNNADTLPVETSASETPVNSEDTSMVSLDGATSTGELGIPTKNPERVESSELVAQEPVKVAESTTPEVKQAVQKTEEVVVEPTPAVDPDAPTQIAELDQANIPATEPKPVVSSSAWKVQISSQRSRSAAEASYNNLKSRFGSVLGNSLADIQKADIEGKGVFYRVKLLAESKTEANKLCSSLKSAGGSCFVTR